MIEPKARRSRAPKNLPGASSRIADSASPIHGAREKRPHARRQPGKKPHPGAAGKKMTGPAAKRQARKKRPKRRPPAAVAAAVDAAQDKAGLNNRVKTGSSNSRRDLKSTRLNSSHVAISYAVFYLKKKIKNSVSVKSMNS